MFLSSVRRRRRRWPFVLAALGILAAGGVVAYLSFVKAPGDVSNPEVDFTAPQPAPEERRERKKRDTRVIWPVYGYTPQRTRFLDADLKPPFRRVWAFGGSKLIEFPPILAKQTLFFQKNNGEAYAISTRSGRVRWRKRVGRLAASSPAWSKGRVFFTTLSGRVTALRARDGRTLWARDLPSRTESSPLAIDGRVYFGSEDGTVYALRAKDGRTAWTYRAGGAVKAALAYSDGKLYFGDYAGQVTAISLSTGRKVWGASTQGRSLGRSGNFYSTPAVAFGRVYVGNTDSRVYSFSARTGELAWSKTTGGYVYGAPAVSYEPEPRVYIGSYDGTFYALDARSGETRWTYHDGGRISGSPTVVGGIVYFSSLGDKSTTGLSVRTGRPVWTFGRGAFTPVVSDGQRLFVTGYSSLYAFEAKTERKRGRASRSRRRAGSR